MSATTTKRLNITSGPMLRSILIFALPLVFSGLLQLFFNAADIVVVGRFAGRESMAAVGSTSSIVNLITNLFVGLSTGASVVAANAFGAKDEKKVHETVHTSVVISLLSGALLVVVGLLTVRTMLEWMDAPDDVIELSALYLRIFFCGMPMTMLYNFGAALLRAIGDTRRPIYCLLLAGIINIGLNLLFVISFHLDVAGVALATIISQTVSAVLITLVLMKEPSCLHLELRKLHINPEALRQILRFGLPSGISGVVFSVSNVVIQSGINSFGSVVIAGNSAASSIEGFVYMSMNAFQHTALTFTGQNAGAKQYPRITRALSLSLACVTVVGLVLGSASYFFGRTLLGIYSPDPDVVKAGLVRLSYVGSFYFICGVMDVIVGSLRGMRQSILPTLISLFGCCALRLVWIATVFQAHHSTGVLYVSYPISWTITVILQMTCWIFVKRHFTKNRL